MRIIFIPEITHQEFGDCLSKLFKILEEIKEAIEEGVVLDFSKARMLNPFFLGGVACVINYYKSEGKTIDVRIVNNSSIESYLNTIRFPNFYFSSIGREDDSIFSLDQFVNKNYIPLISFPNGNNNSVGTIREKILTAVSSILRKQLKLSDAELSPISYMIDELTHNINDHSQSPSGYIFAQYYPAKNYLDICICDHGIGIFKSYELSPKFHPVDEIEAVKFAINGMSTKDRPESKGFGLNTSRNMLVNGLKGYFFLMSGNTSYMQNVSNKGVIILPENVYFQGNFIALRVPTILSKDFNIYNFTE